MSGAIVTLRSHAACYTGAQQIDRARDPGGRAPHELSITDVTGTSKFPRPDIDYRLTSHAGVCRLQKVDVVPWAVGAGAAPG